MHSHPIPDEYNICLVLKHTEPKEAIAFVDDILSDGDGKSKAANRKAIMNLKSKMEANSKDKSEKRLF